MFPIVLGLQCTLNTALLHLMGGTCNTNVILFTGMASELDLINHFSNAGSQPLFLWSVMFSYSIGEWLNIHGHINMAF